MIKEKVFFYTTLVYVVVKVGLVDFRCYWPYRATGASGSSW